MQPLFISTLASYMSVQMTFESIIVTTCIVNCNYIEKYILTGTFNNILQVLPDLMGKVQHSFSFSYLQQPCLYFTTFTCPFVFSLQSINQTAYHNDNLDLGLSGTFPISYPSLPHPFCNLKQH